MRRLALACMLLALVADFAHAANRGAKRPDASYKVVAYYLDRGDAASMYVLDRVRSGSLTHLNYAFAAVRNGEVAFGDQVPEQKIKASFEALSALKHRNPHLQTLISVGGWSGSGEFSNVALTGEAREKFADSAVAFVRKYGFDGVDIDWEFPVSGGVDTNAHRPEDKQDYTLLLQSLRDKLDLAGLKDKRKYLLTVALGNNQQFFGNTEMDKVAGIVDWANLMTYDFNGHWNTYAGHLAPLYDDPGIRHAGNSDKYNVNAAVELTLASGVPAGKIVLGVPFYGYSWKQCGAANNGQLQDCQGKGRGSLEDGTLEFSDIDAGLVNKNGFIRYWNDRAKAPYLFNSGTGEFVSYEDAQSLDVKIDYLKRLGLGGVMFWELGGDRDFVLQGKLAHDLLGK